MPHRVLHHGPSPSGTPVVLTDRLLSGCWFELHRQGGCGAGEIKLADPFALRDKLLPGDWISLESSPGVRCYLGRIEEIRAESPAGMRVRLEGMAIELNEIYPGGFGLQADGKAPHRYAATDLFPFDPDRGEETFDPVDNVDQLLRLLLVQYTGAGTHFQYDPLRIEAPLAAAPISSVKFRGEETLRAIIKDLAVRAQGAAWGIDAGGKFFFLRPRDSVLVAYREGRDLTLLAETRDREHLYNRLLLTGDYVYDRREMTDAIARRVFRWRANYFQPESRQQFGERRIRLWLPWMRTQTDSLAFAREFFRVYSQPTTRYLIETVPHDLETPIPLPWEGRIRLENRQGEVLTTARIETIRVIWDHSVRFRMELGPADPRTLWPEPPHDERWENPEIRNYGGPVSHLDSLHNSDQPPQSTLPPIGSSRTPPSSSAQSSDDSSIDSSLNSSQDSSWESSSHWTSWYDSASSLIGSTQSDAGSSIDSSTTLATSWFTSGSSGSGSRTSGTNSGFTNSNSDSSTHLSDNSSANSTQRDDADDSTASDALTSFSSASSSRSNSGTASGTSQATSAESLNSEFTTGTNSSGLTSHGTVGSSGTSAESTDRSTGTSSFPPRETSSGASFLTSSTGPYSDSSESWSTSTDHSGTSTH